MPSVDLVEQINRSDLDLRTLLRLRTALDQRLVAKRRDLEQQLQEMQALGTGAAPTGKRRGRPPGSGAKSSGGGGRRRARKSTNSAGKHSGISVADAVRKVIEAKGGKLPASEIKKAFDAAGDRRNLNFTLLVRSGALKRNGFEARKGKGRAGGI